mmetsp:Transcript_33523/g.72343  ORF Transcript_33523/g.72343 Transcript_33523/m.72343 type:complete len:95 (-) Transcript_33523:346-630(-)
MSTRQEGHSEFVDVADTACAFGLVAFSLCTSPDRPGSFDVPIRPLDVVVPVSVSAKAQLVFTVYLILQVRDLRGPNPTFGSGVPEFHHAAREVS